MIRKIIFRQQSITIQKCYSIGRYYLIRTRCITEPPDGKHFKIGKWTWTLRKDYGTF